MKDQCGDEMIVQAADLTADPDLNQDPGLLRLQAGNVEDIPGEALVLLDTRRGNFTPVAEVPDPLTRTRKTNLIKPKVFYYLKFRV